MDNADHLEALDRARLRMLHAKRRLTLATEALHRREEGAVERADAAIRELTQARAELNRLTAQDRKPEPVGEWAIAADFKQEVAQEVSQPEEER
jgi:hypothetical protein